MTDLVLKYCARGIIRYLNGDVDRFRYYVNKAVELSSYISCDCGKPMINCKYNEIPARLCTSCGKLWINGNVIRKCLTGRKIA